MSNLRLDTSKISPNKSRDRNDSNRGSKFGLNFLKLREVDQLDSDSKDLGSGTTKNRDALLNFIS